MNKRTIGLTGGLPLVLVVVVSLTLGFYAGRHGSKVFTERPLRTSAAPEAKSRATTVRAESDDLTNVLIQRVATVGFGELYDLMESASPGLREQWLKQIRAMPQSPKRTAALTTFFKSLVQLDPAAATQFMLQSDPGPDRRSAMKVIVGAVHPSAMATVAEALVSLPRDEINGSLHDRNYLQDIVVEWGWSDPAAVGHFLEEHRDEDLVSQTTRFLEGWAQADPAAAKEWLDRYQIYQPIEHGVRAWLDGWYENDSAAAFDYAIAHRSDEDVKPAIIDFVNVLFTTSPDAARNFVMRLPDADDQRAALRDISLFVADAAHGDSPMRQPAAFVANWLVKLPQQAWSSHIGEVLGTWEQQDADAMFTWMNQLPAETHDHAAAAYCSFGTLDQLERKVSMALSISDSTIRDQALRDYLHIVWIGGPDEIKQKIQSSSLPASTKQHLMKLLPAIEESDAER